MTPSNNNSKDGPRSWSRILLFGLFFGTCLVVALVHQGMTQLTHPIELWLDTDAPDAWIAAGTLHGQNIVEAEKLEKRWETGPFTGFKSKRLPYTGIILIGAPTTLDRITRVTLRMTTHSAVFCPSQFRKEWQPWKGPLPSDTPAGWEGRIYEKPLSEDGSLVSLFDRAVNYEGDRALAKYVLLSPIFGIYAISLIVLLLIRAGLGYRPINLKVLLDDGKTNGLAEKHLWPWLSAGLAVLIIAAAMLEHQYPYYFTQDDNFAQFLPNILYGCDMLSAGVFPSWNPHQYMGAPLAEIGTYALTYPGTYLSYGIAAWILGDRNATMEVFCWLHLLFGYLALFWLGRRIGLAAPLAAAFSLCQVLSGFALVCGRSWYYMTPVYLWVPLLFVALLHARTHTPTWRWTLGTGLVMGLFFHAGNAQMWVYGLGLVGLFVLWICLNRSMPWTRLLQIVPAGLVGLGIAAVLLVPQFSATRDLQRKGGEGWDIGEGVFALFAPYPTPIVVAADNQRPYADPEYFGTLYYAGSVFTIAWLAGLLVIGVWRGGERSFLRDPWNALAVLTFLLALGNLALLWTGQAYFPVLKQFNHPLKFLPFFHLFSCAVGARLVNRATGLSPRPRWWQGVTFFVIAGLLLYHAFWSRSAFFVYAEHPYPALPSELSDLKQEPCRILPLTLMRSASKDHVVGMQHHFPTIYGLTAVGGYDPLIEQDARYGRILREFHTNPRSAMRRHGVTHLVLHREVTNALQKRDWAWDDWRWLHSSFNALVTDCENAEPAMQTESVRVFQVKDTTALAYMVNKPRQVLPVRLTPGGLNVDVSSLTTDAEVALCYVWRPGTRVDADGVPVPTSADDDQHIRVVVRAGTRRLEVGYESPWSKGLLVGGILCVAGFFGMATVSVMQTRATYR